MNPLGPSARARVRRLDCDTRIWALSPATLPPWHPCHQACHLFPHPDGKPRPAGPRWGQCPSHRPPEATCVQPRPRLQSLTSPANPRPGTLGPLQQGGLRERMPAGQVRPGCRAGLGKKITQPAGSAVLVLRLGLPSGVKKHWLGPACSSPATGSTAVVALSRHSRSRARSRGRAGHQAVSE